MPKAKYIEMSILSVNVKIVSLPTTLHKESIMREQFDELLLSGGISAFVFLHAIKPSNYS